MKITKRIMQGVTGVCGKVNKKAKNKKLPKNISEIFPEEPKHSKKKKTNKEYFCEWKHCPFCKTLLPIDYKEIERINEENKKRFSTRYYVWEEWYRVTTCPNESCKAYVVKECPSCKHLTWYHPKTKVYKHNLRGCGFEGLKKE